MSETGFPISMPASEYDAYLKREGVYNTVTSPFSKAASYREFLGVSRSQTSDQTLTDLGITSETIEACVPAVAAAAKKDQRAP